MIDLSFIKRRPKSFRVEMLEVLQAILEQDENLKAIFEIITLGKKRSVIFALNKIKDIDKQILNAPKLIIAITKPRIKKTL